MSLTQPIAVFLEDVALQPLLQEVISSLPISLVPSNSMRGAVAAVAGKGDWPARVVAAIAAGASGVVVEDPDPVPSSTLDQLRSAPQPVILDRPYLSNPALAPAAADWNALSVPTLLLDSDLLAPTRADPYAELFRHISLVRAVAEPLTAVDAAAISGTGYSVAGTLQTGTTAILACAITDAGLPRVNIRLLGAPQRLSLTIFTSTTARAATVSLVDADGEMMFPTLYENGHRASWRRMIDAHREDAVVPDLDDFARDIQAFDVVLRGVGA